MSPRFLKSLQESFQGGDDESSREFDQVIEMMSIRLQNTKKAAFIHDLRGALSHCEDDVLPVKVTSGVQLVQRRKIRKKMWTGVGGRYQQLYRKYIDRAGLLASTGPLDSLKPYPDLYHALAPAWSSSKPLMELTKVLIMELVQRGNRVELSENKDTLSIADVTSLLPGHHLTRTALYKITEAFSLQRASVSVISLNWMDDWAQRGETPNLLESLDAYFSLEAGASEKLIYIVPPTADSVQTLAICSVTSSDSGTDYSSTILIGKKSAFPAAEKFLTSLFKKVPQWSATGFLWKRIHSVDVQSISKTAGFPFLGEKVTKCLRDEDIGIALCAAVSISLSTGCSGLGELLDLGKISQEEVDLANVRLESLYVLQLLESAGSSLQADEVPDASESLPNHQDKVLDDDGTHDSDLDLGESDLDEAEMCGSYGFDNLIHPFKVEEIEAAMASIDMDDDEGIAVRIGQTLTAKEKHAFAFSAEDEAALCPAHGENDQQMAKNNADVLKAIEAHKDRLYRVITRTAQFMLSFDSQHDSGISYEWFMLIVANASVESRQRLVRIMSHPRVQPIALQFLLGQRIWTKDMFNWYPKTDLHNLGLVDDFFSAYFGVAHCPDATSLYSGSATRTKKARKGRTFGEVGRMMDHRRCIALGHDEIVSQRRHGSNSLLFVHEIMTSPDTEFYFFPAARFSTSTNISPEGSYKARALTLLIENCNAVLVAGAWPTESSRSQAGEANCQRSHILRNLLQPADFPEPPWRSANKVLPITQGMRCFPLLDRSSSLGILESFAAAALSLTACRFLALGLAVLL
ncbi:hypothetical protein EDB80DRAFT_417858 [Ilyonectria destructans]|nr:hypothetical protein EDB80DRAFT_417858 [Ilyonectria destructans]